MVANLLYYYVAGLAEKNTCRRETFENRRETMLYTAAESPITTDSFGIATDGAGNGLAMELCVSL